jgi:DnaJ domain
VTSFPVYFRILFSERHLLGYIMKSLATVWTVLVSLLRCSSNLHVMAFQSAFPPSSIWAINFKHSPFTTCIISRMTATSRDFGEKHSNNFLLEEFCTYSGESVDPYRTLKVSRDAKRPEIRKAYIGLSKRYHPDGVRHRDILPGKW